MRSRNLVIVVAVAVIIIAAVAGAYWYSLPHYPWLFKGAYATYQGNYTLLFVPLQFDVRLEVMDYNTTHAKIFTLLGVTAMGNTVENSTTAWFSFQEKNFAWPGANFNQTYEGDYYIEGYGVRHCFVAENVSPGGKGLLFIDSQTLWPLKLRFESSVVNFDINIVDSNIPGLKK